jgi:hypothetical protein
VEADGGYTDITPMIAAGACLPDEELSRFHYDRCRSLERD